MPLKYRALLFFLLAPAFSQSTEVSPGDDLRLAISALGAGDELVLSGGTYEFDSRFNITVVGEANRPAVIRAKAGEKPLIRMNTSSQNVIEIQGSRHLVIRGIAFSGGSHGIRLMNSDYVTIEDCEIYETGDVAISANSGGTYEGLQLRRNHIHHTNGTGEGMYLGCNNDACRVLNSTIEWNYIHHTNRATVSQGDGIELKEGSAGNIVRHNVIHDTKYPGILTYSTRGNGAPNLIESNLVWNSNDNAIQSAADAIIRNNIIIGGEIALQSHQAGSPSNHEIVHNTIINDGSGIYVRDVSGPVLIANNAVYSQSGAAIRLISGDLSKVTVAGNVGAGGLSGGSAGYENGNGIAVDFVAASYRNSPPINVFPALESALIDAGAREYAATRDFNGSPRDGTADAGAYRYAAGGNPGWTLSAALKEENSNIRPNPPTDVTAD
ncbi:right-handed parallel beta-helix repeat-containing protein [Lentisalinibacter salinarum]|uniref:right-handed parallel beta-helix repeat-containing protein n=1 Tax=Lentisalinibacter salinarum TaxID=2992239 RepID=UPI00386390F4